MKNYFGGRISLLLIALLAFGLLCISASPYNPPRKDAVHRPVAPPVDAPSLYGKLHLNELGLAQNVYQIALKGWQKLKSKGEISKDILSICDFTQSSNHKRLYVIDLAHGKLLYYTLVAHGKNSGAEFARHFSNQPSSLTSSLGFYVTGTAYTGSHGLALRLSGKEKGFNDKAEERDIVMHGAFYVSQDFINHYGTLGRSFGCPAVPPGLHEQIINCIKDGSCFFIYYPDKKYLSASALVNG